MRVKECGGRSAVEEWWNKVVEYPRSNAAVNEERIEQ
jgi:hypothetical protein